MKFYMIYHLYDQKYLCRGYEKNPRVFLDLQTAKSCLVTMSPTLCIDEEHKEGRARWRKMTLEERRDYAARLLRVHEFTAGEPIELN